MYERRNEDELRKLADESIKIELYYFQHCCCVCNNFKFEIIMECESVTCESENYHIKVIILKPFTGKANSLKIRCKLKMNGLQFSKTQFMQSVVMRRFLRNSGTKKSQLKFRFQYCIR